MDWSINNNHSNQFTFSELQNTLHELKGHHVYNILYSECTFNNTINNIDNMSNMTPSSGDTNTTNNINSNT